MVKKLVKIGSAALMTVAVWLLITLLIRNMGTLYSAFGGDEYISEVLSQLRGARIRVPLYIPLICGGALCLVPWKREWRGRLIAAGVFVFLASLIVCLYFTRVNTVPLGSAVKIIADIFSSGIIEELS